MASSVEEQLLGIQNWSLLDMNLKVKGDPAPDFLIDLTKELTPSF